MNFRSLNLFIVEDHFDEANTEKYKVFHETKVVSAIPQYKLKQMQMYATMQLNSVSKNNNVTMKRRVRTPMLRSNSCMNLIDLYRKESSPPLPILSISCSEKKMNHLNDNDVEVKISITAFKKQEKFREKLLTKICLKMIAEETEDEKQVFLIEM